MIWPWTKLEKPAALPSRLFPNTPDEYTWEDWENETEKKFPVRYFFQETVPRRLRRMWTPVETFKYWFRTHTYNRYHILDLRCPTWGVGYEWGWIEFDQAVLVAPFQVLKLFMEVEFPGHCDWESTPELLAASKELKELYAWWMGRLKVWDDHHSLIEVRGFENFREYRKTPEYEVYRAKGEELAAQDNIMLIRLINVRHFMWT